MNPFDLGTLENTFELHYTSGMYEGDVNEGRLVLKTPHGFTSVPVRVTNIGQVDSTYNLRGLKFERILVKEDTDE